MTRLPAPELATALLLAAVLAWHPVERAGLPPWFVELCAEVAGC